MSMRAGFLALALAGLAFSAAAEPAGKGARQVDYGGFAQLTAEVGAYREARIVGLARFQALARTQGALILDARSADKYAEGHIEGAVNLPFTDFTDAALAETIGDANRVILIYCNNNFANDAAPVMLKRASLALNIPTFINLYGYGYRNIYELGDTIDFNDPRVGWVRAES
jgi:phage shock protein E